MDAMESQDGSGAPLHGARLHMRNLVRDTDDDGDDAARSSTSRYRTTSCCRRRAIAWPTLSLSSHSMLALLALSLLYLISTFATGSSGGLAERAGAGGEAPGHGHAQWGLGAAIQLAQGPESRPGPHVPGELAWSLLWSAAVES